MKRLLLIIQIALVAIAVHAQTLSVHAPSHVQTGENFRLTYTVNTQNVGEFHVGNIPDGLEIITGPYTSSQSSFQMVNGHTSSSSSITYTFIICATKAGSYTISPAHINAGGKNIASHAAKITVSGAAPSNNGAPRMHEDRDDRQAHNAGSSIGEGDLFIRVSANKHRIHEQEPVVLTYKVYTLVDLTELEGKMPDLTGFHTQEVKLSQQKSFHNEVVNGRNYRCVTWSQYVMFPQMTGKLEIPSITFNGTVVQQNRNVDPFEAFFNGGSGYIEVKRSIKAPGVTIQVDPLPQKPAGFSGGVGHFNISAQLDKTTVKANDPATLRVVISGIGNLKLIKEPVVAFPKDFDKYDAKITDKTKLTPNGVEGNMIYDFLVVPRNQGKYTIPAIEFIYYDTSTNSYKTIKTQPFELIVEKGDGSNASANYATAKDEDIHPIKTGKMKITGAEGMFFNSTNYWLILCLLIAAFIVLLVVFRKRAIENADIVKLRSKKANKVATKRLRKADKLMRQNHYGEFYDEVLRALWGYVGDKLNIPVSELSRDNISERFHEHNVDEETITKFVGAIDECEYARYAPGDAAGNMNKTFTSAMSAITQIEDSMKNRKKINTHGWMLLLVTLLLPLTANAITKADGDNEYSRGNYQQAIRDYEELLKQTKSADLYYNLGNAYYRTDNITRAVLAYERALLLSPGDDDIRFNLQMARSKTIDKITPRSEMFFVTWYRALVNITSVDGWADIAVVSMIAALILALVYLFASRMLFRKIGFFGGVAMLTLFLLCNLFAWHQHAILTERTGAIIVSSSATLKATPTQQAKDNGVLHEGTRVDIIDDTMRDWKCVRLADGREGWLQSNKIEKI
ncbi:MAG: BatD family protein [Prevotella sp.]|nr:BatD family protein [Prevotella sp.]